MAPKNNILWESRGGRLIFLLRKAKVSRRLVHFVFLLVRCDFGVRHADKEALILPEIRSIIVRNPLIHIADASLLYFLTVAPAGPPNPIMTNI